MGGAARRCVLLGFNQPRPSFCGGCFDAFGGAFSTINDLRQLCPRVSSIVSNAPRKPVAPIPVFGSAGHTRLPPKSASKS